VTVYLSVSWKARQMRLYGAGYVWDGSSRLPGQGDDDVDQGLRSTTAHARLVADGGRARRGRAEGPVTLIFSLVSGLVALGVGAVVSFAVSSEESKLVVWSVATGITAAVAGVAYESRWVRGLSCSVVRWIQSAQGL